MAERAADPRTRAAAKLAAESYLYPVDSQVLLPGGELHGHLSANDLMMGSDWARPYRELLESALRVGSGD